MTIPKQWWRTWLGEGDLAGEASTGRFYMFTILGRPDIKPGERVYVVCDGKLRGYAPLVEARPARGSKTWLIRDGGAVAVTIDRRFKPFRGHRDRDWPYSEEKPFPDWKTL